MIEYKMENNLSAKEFGEILVNSTLAERRPVYDTERIQNMVMNGNLIITAREGGLLVGVARSLSDFSFCTYLSDLAVHIDYQKAGIGKQLISQIKLAAPQAKLILLSAPKAETYYPKIGMTKFEQCYVLDNVEDLK